jgi:hypothetical protein
MLAETSTRLGIALHKGCLRGFGWSPGKGIEYHAEWPVHGKTCRLSNLHLGENEVLIFQEISTSSDGSSVVNRIRVLTPHGEGQGEITAPLTK